MQRIESFSYNNEVIATEYVSSSEVVPGVVCDVYTHPETLQRDLGIITIEAGQQTPLQKVVKGDETIEGYISGRGVLTITHTNGTRSIFRVSPRSEGFSYSVQVGEMLQWKADDQEQLVVFEICFPPYEDGRFENISV